MTDKTMEEKIRRLTELTGLERWLAKSWLEEAENYTDYEFFFYYSKHKVSRQTWDVHTGAAFTKLYKALA